MGGVHFYQLLGLANRARKIISGEELVLNDLKKNRVKLVIIANDASERTKKKMRDQCAHYQVRIVGAGDRFALGHAIGKEQRVVLGVTDEGFARKLLINLGQ